MTVVAALPADLADQVRRALAEDIGSGDVTARLIPDKALARGRVLCREPAVLCGTAWFDDLEVVRVEKAAPRPPRTSTCPKASPARAPTS